VRQRIHFSLSYMGCACRHIAEYRKSHGAEKCINVAITIWCVK